MSFLDSINPANWIDSGMDALGNAGEAVASPLKSVGDSILQPIGDSQLIQQGFPMFVMAMLGQGAAGGFGGEVGASAGEGASYAADGSTLYDAGMGAGAGANALSPLAAAGSEFPGASPLSTQDPLLFPGESANAGGYQPSGGGGGPGGGPGGGALSTPGSPPVPGTADNIPGYDPGGEGMVHTPLSQAAQQNPGMSWDSLSKMSQSDMQKLQFMKTMGASPEEMASAMQQMGQNQGPLTAMAQKLGISTPMAKLGTAAALTALSASAQKRQQQKYADQLRQAQQQQYPGYNVQLAPGHTYSQSAQGQSYNPYGTMGMSGAVGSQGSQYTGPQAVPSYFTRQAHGGLSHRATGNMFAQHRNPGAGALASAGQRLVQGPGGGQDDKIPAALSDGEYVMDADTVSALGDGSNKAGAQKLDSMRMNVRAHKRGAPTSKIPPKAKAPEQYLGST